MKNNVLIDERVPGEVERMFLHHDERSQKLLSEMTGDMHRIMKQQVDLVGEWHENVVDGLRKLVPFEAAARTYIAARLRFEQLQDPPLPHWKAHFDFSKKEMDDAWEELKKVTGNV